MNRPIKFKVWDKMRLQFIYPENNNQQHFIIDLNGQFHNLQNGSGVNDYVVQQYTELKDKNDKEICEGDIVKWAGLNYLVEWNHTAYKWQGRCPYYAKYHHPTTEHFIHLRGGVIVGNTFENPELLKQYDP